MTDESPRREEWTAPAAGSPPPTSPSPALTAPAPADWLGRLLVPVMESRSWLKFLGVVGIIAGVITALTIVGLIFAWVYIWVGMLLCQAANRAEVACTRRDPAMLEQYLDKLKTLITIAGIFTVLSVILSIIGVTLAMFFGWMGWLASHF